jgi:hypothetical protein
MTTLFRIPLALAMAGALTLASVSPSAARSGRTWAAAGIGFAAGALFGAAAANARANYYAPGYYAGPAPSYGYAVEPGYVAEPGYVYEPAPVYTYGPAYYDRVGSPNYNPYICSTDEGYGRRGSCDR